MPKLVPRSLWKSRGVPGLKIALVADTDELFVISYRYVEGLAMERGPTARAFRSEEEARGRSLKAARHHGMRLSAT